MLRTPYSYLNVKEIFAQNRGNILILIDCNESRTKECEYPLKRVRDMIRTYIQRTQLTDKYSQHS